MVSCEGLDGKYDRGGLALIIQILSYLLFAQPKEREVLAVKLD